MSDTAKSPSSIDIGSPTTTNDNVARFESRDKVKLTWNDQTETLLRSWGDISSCYNWMHDKSFRKYQKKNFKFSLPVIILSTLTGTLNLALQGYVPEQYMTYAQAGIGGVNIFTGILTTLQNYFRYAENSESHRNASVGWGKLQRNISIELTYDRLSRKDADSFIKVCRMEYDRLLEQSPIIPTEIINLFKKKYAEQRKKKKDKKKSTINSKTPKKDDDDDVNISDIDDDDDKLILPDVCGELTHTGVYKESLNECTRLDKLLDIKESEQSKLIPEIKDVLLDRLNILEQRLSVAQTPRAEFKPLSEYSAEELQIALERKNTINNIVHRSQSLSTDAEQAINKAIQKHIEPLNLNLRRMSDQLQKPTLSRVNTSYMGDIAITENKERDFSFRDLMKKFQKDAPVAIKSDIIEIKEQVKEEIKENIENVENKNIEKNILQENNFQEINNIINKNQNLTDIIPDNNIITQTPSKVFNDGSDKVKNSISKKILESPIKQVINTKPVVEDLKIDNVESVFEELNDRFTSDKKEIELSILDIPNKESKDIKLVVENIMPQVVDLSAKPKIKKNNVEITKGNVIGKNQPKLKSFFQPDKVKEEKIKIDIEESSIEEDLTTSEPSTFEISINDNEEDSIKINFIDTDDDEDDKK